MSEIISSKIIELGEEVEKLGLLKIVFFNFMYTLTLFFMSVGIIILYDQWFYLNFNSSSYVVIVATIFILVTSIDMILLFNNKITPTLLLLVIAVSPVLVLYKMFKDGDILKLNRKTTPAAIRRYIFPFGNRSHAFP